MEAIFLGTIYLTPFVASKRAIVISAGATRVLFGTLGFILIMNGTEHMKSDSFWSTVDWKLVAIGAFCIYAAFFWESVKKRLSADTQSDITKFAQHGATKAVLLLCALATIILSPFVEQHRWPFSYPTDPSILADNATLHDQVGVLNSTLAKEKEAADKWRFVSELWRSSQTNAGPPECKYQIQYSGRAANVGLEFLRSLLQSAGWEAASFVQNDGGLQPGITIRSSGDATTLDAGSSSPRPSFQCASALQKSLSDFYPSPLAKLITNQSTAFLDRCARVCVEIDVDY
jgi:hypothetical protein